MKALRIGTLLRLLAPALAGVTAGVAVQLAEPKTRLYALVSPGLLAGMAGLLSTVVIAAVALIRHGQPTFCWAGGACRQG